MEQNRNFSHLQSGDRVKRLIGGISEMNLIVISNKEGIITCTIDTSKEKKLVGNDFKEIAGIIGIPLSEEDIQSLEQELPSWTFRSDNGMEVDEDLGWDGTRITGSYLLKEE